MAIENTPNIFNSAAVVNTTSRRSSTGSISPKQPSNNEGAVKVEISPQVSALSRSKAANGSNALSPDSLAAIAAGRPAPSIARIETPPALAEVAAEISSAQLSQINDSPTTEPPANIEALARAAAAFEAVASLSPEQPTAIPANIETLLTSTSGGSNNVQVSQQQVPVTQDTATAALGNTADITV